MRSVWEVRTKMTTIIPGLQKPEANWDLYTGWDITSKTASFWKPPVDTTGIIILLRANDAGISLLFQQPGDFLKKTFRAISTTWIVSNDGHPGVKRACWPDRHFNILQGMISVDMPMHLGTGPWSRGPAYRERPTPISPGKYLQKLM